MNIISQPTRIGKMEFKNRLVRSATAERLADKNGAVTDDLVRLYEQLAKGGVGTIITGHSFVRSDGRSGWQMMGIDKDNLIKGLSRLTKVVHQYDTRIFVQLNHTGRLAQGAIIGTNPLTPSVTESVSGLYPPKEMTETDIKNIIRSFGEASERAREAGFDGVQIHSAHGYLSSQFLSKDTNRRGDSWGGSQEKRSRFIVEIYNDIRQRLGPDFPIWVKMNCEDFTESGMTLEESLVTAELLEKERIDAIEISGGISFNTVIRPEVGTKSPEAYFLHQAEQFRAGLKIPLILVGGIRSVRTMEMLLKDKGISLISMSRPFIREPDFVVRIIQKSAASATCISCNRCLLTKKTEPITCQQKNH